jgi:hypothetical protein
MSRRHRLLTAAVLHASEYAPLRSRIVPAAAALPKVFAGIRRTCEMARAFGSAYDQRPVTNVGTSPGYLCGLPGSERL